MQHRVSKRFDRRSITAAATTGIGPAQALTAACDWPVVAAGKGCASGAGCATSSAKAKVSVIPRRWRLFLADADLALEGGERRLQALRLDERLSTSPGLHTRWQRTPSQEVKKMVR